MTPLSTARVHYNTLLNSSLRCSPGWSEATRQHEAHVARVPFPVDSAGREATPQSRQMGPCRHAGRVPAPLRFPEKTEIWAFMRDRLMSKRQQSLHTWLSHTGVAQTRPQVMPGEGLPAGNLRPRS